jgi:hypothetical protein
MAIKETITLEVLDIVLWNKVQRLMNEGYDVCGFVCRSDGFVFFLVRKGRTYKVHAGCRGTNTFAWWKKHVGEYRWFFDEKDRKLATEKKRETLAILALFEKQIKARWSPRSRMSR